jgi:hypothetical protein
MNTDIFRRPSWSFGAVVWLCAVFVFPLHLGWSGAPAVSLVAYSATAAGLLLVADALHDPDTYPTWRELRFQAAPFLLAVAVPAAVAFALGQVLAPAEASFEDDVCRLGGFSPTPETSLEELNDSLDLTADCSLDAGV